jgi:hypothetical protein
MKLNIAYGDTPPEDTTKLWVKCEEPEGVRVLPNIRIGKQTIVSALLPYAATEMYAAAVGPIIYLFGGTRSGGLLNTIYAFDVETLEITKQDALIPNSGAYGIAYALVDTNVYIIGGYNSSYRNTIHVFNTETSTMSTHSSTLPVAMSAMGYATVGASIYLFGGNRNSKGQDSIVVFNTETATISTLSAKMPVGVMDSTAAAVGTKVYLFGGNTNDHSDIPCMFDTETTTMTTLPVKLDAYNYWITNIESAVVGNDIYLFGGSRESSVRLDTIWVFDTDNVTLSELNTTLFEATYGIASAVIGTDIYLFGGYSSAYSNRISTFTPYLSLERNHVAIFVGASKDTIEIAPQVSLGVRSVYKGNSEGIAEPVEAYIYKDGTWTLI